MKKYRRIEISAFRRRVTITSEKPEDSIDAEVIDTGSPISIDVDSMDGQDILVEAIRLLEEKLSK